MHTNGTFSKIMGLFYKIRALFPIFKKETSRGDLQPPPANCAPEVELFAIALTIMINSSLFDVGVGPGYTSSKFTPYFH